MDKNEEEIKACCGDCCWFCQENTDGWGFCNTPEKLPEHTDRSFTNCEMPVRENATCGYVSRQEMRHHQYVLLVVKYWFEGNHRHDVSPHEIHEALSFAFKYIKTFYKI